MFARGLIGRGIVVFIALLLGIGSVAAPGTIVRAATTPITDCDHFVGQGGKTGLADALATYATGDTLLFSCGGSLTTAHLVPVTAQIALTRDVTIDGGGYAITLDGGSVSPTPQNGGIVSVSSGTLTVIRLTIANGHASQNGGALFINANGVVNLTNVTLTGNTAGGPQSSFGEAGAIEVNGGALNATNCTFVNNQALADQLDVADGGAITFRNGPNTVASRVTNCTFADNQATGGISVGGAIAGILGAAFPIITASLFVRNQAAQGPNISGPLAATSDYNMADDGSGGDFAHPHDIVTATPGVGVLGSNGGPTQTVPLLAGSPAIDQGTNAAITNPPFSGPPFTDQRGDGFPRIANGTVDIGAYEVPPPIPTYVVRSQEDGTAAAGNCVQGNDAGCRLRDAIAQNEANGGGHTITFGVSGTITLTSGALALAQDVTIQGPGASTLTVGGSGGDAFAVNSGTAVISGLTIIGNKGVGVHVFSAATVSDTVISANADGITNSGGGLVTIANSTTSGNGDVGMNNNAAGVMRITNSTTSGNKLGIENFGMGNMMVVGSTVNGNGIGIQASGTLTVVNSTISGNTEDGIQGFETLIVMDSTLSGNATGVDLVAGTLALGNSIVAGNTTDIKGSITTDRGHNLTGVPPMLAALGNYGGSTQTLALLPVSPAIDIIPAPCPAAYHDTITNTDITLTTDQRGFPRLAGSGCDAGSVEFRGFTLTKTGGDGQSTRATTPFPSALVISLAANEAGGTVSGIPVTFSLPTSGASATFAPLAGCALTNGNLTATCPSNEGGVVTSPPLTANGTPGGFSATAGAPGASAVTFSLTNTLAATTASAQDAATSFSTTAQSITLNASVTSAAGTVNAGTVTFTVLQGATVIGSPVISSTVTTGSASASYQLPANSPAAVYTIHAVYNPGLGFGSSQDDTHTLTIAAGVLALHPSSLPHGAVAAPYSQTLTATGGSGTGFTFTLASGTLPGGLTLSAGGVLSGTPTLAGTSTFTVMAMDNASNRGTQAYTLTIDPAALTGITLSAPGSANGALTMKVGQSAQLIATATYADGTTQTLPAVQVQWQLADRSQAIATLDGNGTVTGLSPGGAVTVTGTFNGVTGQIAITVTAPTTVGIAPAPAPASRPGAASVPNGSPSLTPQPLPAGR
jgi:hypothetical protein